MIIESNICAHVLLNLLNLLRKRNKILGKPRILSLSPTSLINSIKHEHSCKILYVLIQDTVLIKIMTHVGGQWLSSRVLESRPRGWGLEPHRHHCVVSLSKNIYPSLVLVQPRNYN